MRDKVQTKLIKMHLSERNKNKICTCINEILNKSLKIVSNFHPFSTSEDLER